MTVLRVHERGIAAGVSVIRKHKAVPSSRYPIRLRRWKRATTRPTAAMMRNISPSANPPIVDPADPGPVCERGTGRWRAAPPQPRPWPWPPSAREARPRSPRGARHDTTSPIHSDRCAGLERLLDGLAEVGRGRAGSAVLQPGGEGRDDQVRVVAGPVEPAVDGVLHPPPHRVERAAAVSVETATATWKRTGVPWSPAAPGPYTPRRAAW